MKKFLQVLTLLTVTAIPAMADGPEDAEKYLKQPMPEQWAYTPEVRQTLPDEDEWWKKFEDNTLDSLITLGMSNNYNVRAAARRREMARLAMKQAQSNYYPTIGISAGYSRERESGSPIVMTPEYNLGAEMNWQIDVFGKITQDVRSKRASYNAKRADYVATMVSVVADIATYYINLRVLQNRLAVAERHLAQQERVVKIVEARHEAGLVSKLDVAQAKSVLFTTKATVPSLQTQITTTTNALAMLLGVYPEQITDYLGTISELPTVEHIIPAGVPVNLLRRRPDIVSVEYQLAADAAAIGVAKKDFLPTLTLEGTIGFSAPEMKHLFKDQGFGWSIAPKLSWTLFDGFARNYAVESAREQLRADVDDYNLTVMTAVQEVNNAISSYYSALTTFQLYRNVFEQNQQAFSIAIEQYKEGLSSFTNVVDAQIDWLNSANSLVSARGNALVALVDLYKALGGSPVPTDF
ncbi:MAG: TolC family protein [Duncaniella sp.]|nr:TolC family protein [Duncaniella sp.]